MMSLSRVLEQREAIVSLRNDKCRKKYHRRLLELLTEIAIQKSISEEKENQFLFSLDLNKHPLKNMNGYFKRSYIFFLLGFLEGIELNEFQAERLKKYKNVFLFEPFPSSVELPEKFINFFIFSKRGLFGSKYKYLLICDLALILSEPQIIQKVATEIKGHLIKSEQEGFNDFVYAIVNLEKVPLQKSLHESLLAQYYANKTFINQREKRVIVTANMSAGKSTLINFLAGKRLTKTSFEICTGNAYFVFNKPFEDGSIHFENVHLTLDASKDDLNCFSWDHPTRVASYFRSPRANGKKICIVDTPGVNSAINHNHGHIAKKEIKNGNFDTIIHVLNANKLGSEEEIAHLKWVFENVPNGKVIFVLNKLDTFNQNEDVISSSIDGVRRDLEQIGFIRPVICPLSAYAGLLFKLKHYGDPLSADEEDEYLFLRSKFNKSAYDLSKYHKHSKIKMDDTDFVKLSKRCGIYAFEEILFGGIS